MQETEARIDEVVVEKQALAPRWIDERPALGELKEEGAARFEHAEYTDETRIEVVALSQFVSALLHSGVGGQVLERASGVVGQFLCMRFQAARLVGQERLRIDEADVILVQ